MDLIKLRYFIEVCRYSSMTKAARSLFVSQQNISKAIASLESELGTTLFVRSGTMLRLTSDGEYLLQKANWILAEEKRDRKPFPFKTGARRSDHARSCTWSSLPLLFIVNNRHPLAKKEKVTLYQMAQFPWFFRTPRPSRGRLSTACSGRKD